MGIDKRLPRVSLSSVDNGVHMLYTYNKSADSLLSAAHSYISSSIEAGDPVIMIIPDHYHKELKDSLPCIQDLKRSRMLVLTTPEHVYLDKGRFSYKQAREQLKKVSKRVGSCSNARLFGVGESLIFPDRYSMLKTIEYDCSINRGFSAKMAVCAYDVAAVPDDLMTEVVACHPFLWDGNAVKKNTNYLPPDSFYKNFYARGSHKFAWPAEPRNCREARIAVAELVARMPFDPDEIDAIVLAAGEAVTNAIRHGSPNGGDNKFTLDVGCFDDHITIEVTDEGCGLNCAPAPINLVDPGGRGLYIMEQICDSVEYTTCDCGWKVRLTKYTTRPPL
jgi:serine/threonine-protein kinase RsbW